MLSKSARLNISEKFRWVSGGRKYESVDLRLCYRFSDNQKALVGVAVGSKSFRKAHLRVEAKRKIYEAVRQVYPDLPAGLNLVIMPKPSVLETEIGSIVQQIKDAKIGN